MHPRPLTSSFSIDTLTSHRLFTLVTPSVHRYLMVKELIPIDPKECIRVDKTV